MGSRAGVLKVAAARTGLDVEDYMTRRLAGEKWCTAHKAWHPLDAFLGDKSRGDGVSSSCAEARQHRARATYEPRPRPARGRRFVPARDDDKLQARRRVNYLVDAGLLPDPDDVACTDCGHKGADRRHEYDHHAGYAAERHEDVEAVCSPCHHERERCRG